MITPKQGLFVSRRIKGAKAYQSGLDAEKSVIRFLQQQGFILLAHRCKTPCGEIDLVFSREDWLIAIEVKQRKTHYESAFALTPRQGQRLLSGFEYLISAHPDWQRTNTRFDVALVDKAGGIEIIADAIRLF